MEQRKTPPYGKHLWQLQCRGLCPKSPVWLFIGFSAWEKGRNNAIDSPITTLVLPPWVHPYRFAWPVQNCTMLIIDTWYNTPDDYVTDTINALFRDRARIVHVYRPERYEENTLIPFSFNTYDKEVTS